MKSTFEGQTMVFRKDHEGKVFYSTQLGKKKQDGTYDNAYIDLQFKKGVDIPNRTTINVENGWLTFWLNKDKKPVWQVFVSDYEVLEYGEEPQPAKKPVDEKPPAIPEGFQALEDDDSIPF
jgi:hypothetical protein